MRGKHTIVLSLTAAALIGAVALSPSLAVTWNSFKQAEVYDIEVVPDFTGATPSYQLVVGAAPTVTFREATYAVKFVKAVYAVGPTKTAKFTATRGNDILGWRWDYRNKKGMIAGYTSRGKYHLTANQSLDFAFGSFDPGTWDLYAGFHLVYLNDRGRQRSGWFKVGTNPEWFTAEACPEPSSLMALGLPAAGVMGLLRRRRS